VQPDTGAAPTASSDDVDAMLAALAVGLGKSSLPVSQTQDLLGQVARVFDHAADFSVLSTILIIGDPSTGRFRLQAIDGSYRFDQVEAVQEELARALSGNVSPVDITAALQKIDVSSAPSVALIRILGYGLACIGFAAALRLSPDLLLVALGLGLLVGVALVTITPKSNGGVLLPVAATFICALVIGIFADVMGIEDPVRLAAVPVLFLLPGAAITASVIELVSGDMLAGSSRLAYSIMQLLAMGFAFALGTNLAGVPSDDLADLSANAGPAWLAWVGALAFAAGISVYGCLPRRIWAATLFLAVFAFTVQQFVSIWVAPPLAGGVAAALALLGAFVLNRQVSAGPTAFVLFIPAFWLIVPGSLGFTALTGVLTFNVSLSSLGPQAAFTFIAMAIGIMLASLIWDWRASSQRQKQRTIPPPT
jgi:uncharacterized membrane protein YjjP (DUF1212 family)